MQDQRQNGNHSAKPQKDGQRHPLETKRVEDVLRKAERVPALLVDPHVQFAPRPDTFRQAYEGPSSVGQVMDNPIAPDEVKGCIPERHSPDIGLDYMHVCRAPALLEWKFDGRVDIDADSSLG